MFRVCVRDAGSVVWGWGIGAGCGAEAALGTEINIDPRKTLQHLGSDFSTFRPLSAGQLLIYPVFDRGKCRDTSNPGQRKM